MLSTNELAVEELLKGYLISFIIHFCNSKFDLYHVEKHSELVFRILETSLLQKWQSQQLMPRGASSNIQKTVVVLYLDLFNFLFCIRILSRDSISLIIFNDLPGLFVYSQLYLASVQVLDNLLHYLASHIKIDIVNKMSTRLYLQLGMNLACMNTALRDHSEG